jgi:hypothetical protein
MSGIVRIVTDTSRPKHVDMFYYANTSTDLVDGELVEIDLAATTYGVGKTVIQSTTTLSLAPGVTDRAVDASVDSPLWIPLVTQGVKASCKSASVAVKDEVGQSTGAAGTLTDAAGDAGNAIGRCTVAESVSLSEIWFFGLYRCTAPA